MNQASYNEARFNNHNAIAYFLCSGCAVPKEVAITPLDKPLYYESFESGLKISLMTGYSMNDNEPFINNYTSNTCVLGAI